jgi:hypothetical protein
MTRSRIFPSFQVFTEKSTMVVSPWFIALLVTHQPFNHRVCPSVNLLQVSPLSMSNNEDDQWNENSTAQYSRRLAILAGLPICAAWTASSLVSHIYPETDAPVEGDIRKTAAKVLTSATKVRISVEDRRLSLGVLGKSSEELQKQLDSCE